MTTSTTPTLIFEQGKDLTIQVSGVWQVHVLAQPGIIKHLMHVLKQAAMEAKKRNRELVWDLSKVSQFDHIGAQFLWNAWGKQRPAQLHLSSTHEEFFSRLAEANTLVLPPRQKLRFASITQLGLTVLSFLEQLHVFVMLIGRLVLNLGHFLRHPLRAPWKEISANIFHTGFQALAITALVGFLIGVVLSYLSAQQLRIFGGDIYLVNILGMSIIRELGPLLAAILVAGRSGSSITAQLGVMRVTEELDAMQVMGISPDLRLILPKMLALAISMPLLVIWTDAMALLGGLVAAKFELGLSAGYFLQRLPNTVALANYWIGLGKGLVFGILIALVSCHFGLRIKPNTESLGRETHHVGRGQYYGGYFGRCRICNCL